MTKLVILFFLTTAVHNTSFCQQSTAAKKQVIQFKLDLLNEKNNVTSHSSVGIRGNIPPLSWSKTYPMTYNSKFGIYEASIPFEVAVHRIEYKYFHDTASWESSGNRMLVLKNSSVLPVDRWNIVPLINTRQYQDSLEEKELYNTIAKHDSTFFDTYNNCNLDANMSYFADSFEFYHDKGGLMTSHEEMRNSIKNNVCGKVRRELIKGSIEVSPVPGFGAVEIGMHRFHNLAEKSVSRAARFIIIWKIVGEQWRISKVISLH